MIESYGFISSTEEKAGPRRRFNGFTGYAEEEGLEDMTHRDENVDEDLFWGRRSTNADRFVGAGWNLYFAVLEDWAWSYMEGRCELVRWTWRG